MSSSRKGRLSPITGAFAADIATVPTTGPHQLCYYSEGFDAGDNFQNDDVICHGTANGRDKTPPAPALKRASGAMTVPFDVSQLGFFLQMLLGPATNEVEDNGVSPSRWTRTFVSGLNTQRLAAFSLPVTDDKYKLIQPSFLNSLSFAFAKQDGYRTMDLGFLVPDAELVASQPAFAAAGSPTQYVHKKVPGSVGTFAIGGTVVANITGGSFNYSNQAELTDLSDGTDKALGLEDGDTQIRTDLTMRVVSGVGVNDVLDNFQGAEGSPFAASLNFPLDANGSLEIAMPYCVGERRLPLIGGAQRQSFSASLEAFQSGGSPSATFTLVNQHA